MVVFRLQSPLYFHFQTGTVVRGKNSKMISQKTGKQLWLSLLLTSLLMLLTQKVLTEEKLFHVGAFHRSHGMKGIWMKRYFLPTFLEVNMFRSLYCSTCCLPTAGWGRLQQAKAGIFMQCAMCLYWVVSFVWPGNWHGLKCMQHSGCLQVRSLCRRRLARAPPALLSFLASLSTCLQHICMLDRMHHPVLDVCSTAECSSSGSLSVYRLSVPNHRPNVAEKNSKFLLAQLKG